MCFWGGFWDVGDVGGAWRKFFLGGLLGMGLVLGYHEAGRVGLDYILFMLGLILYYQTLK